MNIFNKTTIALNRYLVVGSCCLLALTGCGSDSDEDSNTGYVNFYNASKNAPALFLTVDEDLDDDSDDHVELTFNSVEYANAIGNFQIDTDNYFIELAWQDEDSATRDNLEIIYEGSIDVNEDDIQFIVISEDITAPVVNIYNIEKIDDEDDTDDDLFNMRVLNIHPDSDPVDVYISTSDETFNEAQLIGNFSYTALSENTKYDQDEYIFYITLAGSTEILYTSNDESFGFPSQYVMVVRENAGAGQSPYTIDKVSNSSTVELLDAESEAQFSAYNGIRIHELLPTYTGVFEMFINGVDEEADVSGLAIGQTSDSIILDKGDYSLDLLQADGTPLLRSHLFSLTENSSKTVFFYLNEEDVDLDGDGDVDEDGDGQVDEIEVTINSLIVDNSTSESIFAHNIGLINLVDDEDFSFVRVYFVRNDETIDTAVNNKFVSFADPESINLLNNTYQVFVVADVDSSAVILSSFELILDETSVEQFIVIEDDPTIDPVTGSTGYVVKIIDQSQPSQAPEL